MPSGSLAPAVSAIVAGAVKPAPSIGLVSDTVGSVAQLRRARSTFNRPLVTTRPTKAGMTSTVLSNAALSCVVVNAQPDRTRAAAPATCGVAIDVPLREPYPL